MKEFNAESGTAIAEHDDAHAGTEMRIVQLLDIEPSLTNPRKHFDPVKLGELADSIRASGVHQPVLLRPLPGSRVPETFGFRRQGSPLPVYELIAGERRFRASKIAGTTTIPAMIRPLTDEQVLEIQIVENLQRDDLTELEEAEGYEVLIQASGMSAEAVGAKIGKSRSYVYARLKLTALCFDARKALREGKIDASKGLLIARIPTEALQLKALEEISALGYDNEPRYSYREAAAHIQRNYMLRLDSARFKITDATLVPEMGSCRECPMRTGHEPDLFADVQSKDTCTNPPCFHTKDQVHQARMLEEAAARGQTVIAGREAKALMPNSWDSVAGYLRIDEVRDSPTDKPLRKLIGDQLKAADVQPTLLANPHKEGELIAILPASTVAELLKAAGHEEATKRVETDLKGSAESAARQEKQDKKRAFETRWRWGVLEACWATLKKGSGLADVPVIRCAAEHYVALLNVDGAKQLCKLLGLGKVAPKDGIEQFLADSKDPLSVLSLLIAFRDVEYRHWITDREPNPRLLMIAEQCDVDVEAVKTATKAEIREEERAAAAKAEKASAATLLAAQPEGDGGRKPKGQKSTGGPAAPARKPKASAKETMSGIAAAMQELDETAANAAAAPAAVAAEDPALRQLGLAVGFAAGQRVRVTSDKDKLPGRVFKYLGKEGTIKNKMGDRAWMVTFRGRVGGVASFDESELEALPQAEVAA